MDGNGYRYMGLDKILPNKQVDITCHFTPL